MRLFVLSLALLASFAATKSEASCLEAYQNAAQTLTNKLQTQEAESEKLHKGVVDLVTGVKWVAYNTSIFSRELAKFPSSTEDEISDYTVLASAIAEIPNAAGPGLDVLLNRANHSISRYLFRNADLTMPEMIARLKLAEDKNAFCKHRRPVYLEGAAEWLGSK